MKEEEMTEFLAESETIRFKNDAFQEFMLGIPKAATLREQAIHIYTTVRDSFLYDPYHLDLRKEALLSTHIITKKRAWCVEKAVVAVACFRAFHIPARFGFGIVKNHIGVEKLTNYLQREEIVFHGFVEVFLEGKWVKCTPAFDPMICKLAKVPLLEWDGETDSLLQAYSGEESFMEYLHFYGSFTEIPFALMHQEMYNYYPHLFTHPIDTRSFSFHFDPQLL